MLDPKKIFVDAVVEASGLRPRELWEKLGLYTQRWEHYRKRNSFPLRYLPALQAASGLDDTKFWSILKTSFPPRYKSSKVLVLE